MSLHGLFVFCLLILLHTFVVCTLLEYPFLLPSFVSWTLQEYQFSYLIIVAFSSRELCLLHPTSLSRFGRVLDLFAIVLVNCPLGTLVFIGVFIAGICNFITFLLSVKASGNWYTILYIWIIFWNSSSHWLVWGSRWDRIIVFQNNFTPFFKLQLFSP